MPTLRSEYTTILTAFAGLFSKRVWQHVQILLLGAILAPGQRTVTAILRIMGLSCEKHFQNFIGFSIVRFGLAVKPAGCFWDCWWLRLLFLGQWCWAGRYD